MAVPQQIYTDEKSIRKFLLKELPVMLEEDPDIRRVIIRVSQNRFADKTDERFERLFEELKKDREENSKRWEENNKRWEENNNTLKAYMKKSDERFAAMMEEIKDTRRRYDSTRGALGTRWGIASESSFRKALKAILEDRFDVQVLNVTEYDSEGFVFGQPDQVELDVIIKNGEIIVCAIKSSMSRSDIYTFFRKVQFYEKRHQCKVSSKIVVSPMVDNYALSVAEKLGIEVYTFAENVKL